jgi:hypothetical protein
MSIRLQNMPFPNASDRSDATQEIEGAQRQYRSIPTPDDVRKFGLVGVPKKLPLTEEPITDDILALHLETAIQELQLGGLNVYQKITRSVEDMYEADLLNRFQPFKLKEYPVLQIESISLMFPNAVTDNPYATYTFPPEWYQFEGNKVNIVATSGTVIPSFSGAVGTTPIPFAIYGAAKYRPSCWRITYQCGFENDFLPVSVWNLVIDKAVLSLLSDLGPLLFSVNTYNVGIDQVQQSVTLPGPKLLEARLDMLKKRITKNFNQIAAYYGCRIQTQYAGR